MIANLLLASIISTLKIIKLFRVNIFMPVTKLFCRLAIKLFCNRRPFWIFDQFRGLFKEIDGKNWGFRVEKERKKTNG